MADLSRPYPREWSVTRALDAYLEENGFEREEYDAPWVSVSFWWLTFPFPNPPQRRKAVRLHDLHHVATGYGTDPAGEAEISAWELRRGLRGLRLFIKCIVTGGALMGLFVAPARTRAAWRHGASGGGTLFDRSLEEDYPRMLDWTVGELREHLGVPAKGLAEARGLHSAAPSHAV